MLAGAPGHPAGPTGSLPTWSFCSLSFCSSSCSFSSCVRQMWERMRLWQKDSRKDSRGSSWARNCFIWACGEGSGTRRSLDSSAGPGIWEGMDSTPWPW